MPRRTRPKDVDGDLRADELEQVVVDKRKGWRADAARARRRHRRYGRRVLEELQDQDLDAPARAD